MCSPSVVALLPIKDARGQSHPHFFEVNMNADCGQPESYAENSMKNTPIP